MFLYKLNTSNWMNWLNWLNWLKWLDLPSQYRVTPIFHGSGVLSGVVDENGNHVHVHGQQDAVEYEAT